MEHFSQCSWFHSQFQMGETLISDVLVLTGWIFTEGGRVKDGSIDILLAIPKHSDEKRWKDK